MKEERERFYHNIYGIVEEIPQGKVATYGLIAKLAGREQNSRLVGRALKESSLFGEFPCHRVVNSQGRLTPGWAEQRKLLTEEGVTFKENGNVDLGLCLWKPGV